MISNRPYLIRAIYDWIVDNDWTPHLQVDANYPGVEVPVEYVQEGMIVLNVSPTAVGYLSMENARIAFRARFAGIERSLSFPPEAVLAVFARENGHGMPFPPEPYPEDLADSEWDAPSDSGLSAVDSKTAAKSEATQSQSSPAGKKSSSSTKPGTSKASKSSAKSSKKPAKKPTLTVVK